MKRTRINPRSKKRIAISAERRAVVERLLAKHPLCQACSLFAKHDGLVTYRAHHAVDVHEIINRSQGGSIVEEDNLLAVCRQCHTRIGNYPLLARELGLHVMQFAAASKTDALAHAAKLREGMA